MKKVQIADWDALQDRKPAHALIAGVDLVVTRYDDKASVLYGRCAHRGALMCDGHVSGKNLYCGLHGWDYRLDTGISAYNNAEKLHCFRHFIEEGKLWVDEDEVSEFARHYPQAYARKQYLGAYADIHGTDIEPWNRLIRSYARFGLSRTGAHGVVEAMGVPRQDLPSWDDIQIITAQLHRPPLLEDTPVACETVIGPRAQRPLRLSMPIFVSDMSFGALSASAKTALALGADAAGTGICSGEGGMLPEEQQANRRYFYELASARFGFSKEMLQNVQAFHFKGGQAAKTGTGGHLPGHKVTGRIAEIRNLPEGKPAISPSRFPEWDSIAPIREFANQVREWTGGIPIGYKLSAQHIEKDIDAALEVGVDYIILDGRGGGTGAAPVLFRDNISVPTIPALARARAHLDRSGCKDVSLIITGGLRHPADFVKALALGADAVAIANAALQAIGCLAMRACHTDNCPVGIATQKPHLIARLEVEKSAAQLTRFLETCVELMKILARACGHKALRDFSSSDLVAWKRDMASLAGIAYGGAGGVGSTHSSTQTS